MGVRRQAREAALQGLFMCDSLGEWDADSIEFCFDSFSIPKQVRPYAFKIVRGVIENLNPIDSKISCASEHWSLSRMARVDRAILRLAVFELAYLDDIPVNVAIDEAIEIAKRFGAENSPTFVNGVLDQIANTLRDQVFVEKVVPPQDEAAALSSDDDEAAIPDDATTVESSGS